MNALEIAKVVVASPDKQIYQALRDAGMAHDKDVAQGIVRCLSEEVVKLDTLRQTTSVTIDPNMNDADLARLVKELRYSSARSLPETPLLWATPDRLTGCMTLAQSIIQSRHALTGERADGCVLYKTGDSDAPEAVLDRNGEVVLDCCRQCGRAEIELDGSPCPNKPANDNKQAQTYTSQNHDETFIPRTDAADRYCAALAVIGQVVEPRRLNVLSRLLVLQDTCYGLASRGGWWNDLETGEDVREWPKKHLDNWISAKLMLVVTEVAEAMEGHRKGLLDDKLPHRPMLEVELADAVIRCMDLAGGLNMDLGGAIIEKMAFNMSRADHKVENRKAAGGKSV